MSHRIRHARGSVVFTTAALLALVTACDTISNPLDVEGTSRIPAETILTPANAQLLVDGAIADFECAFAAYTVQSATVGEEFIYAQQTAARTPSDARRVINTDQEYSAFPCTSFGIYVPLQTARASAETVMNFLMNVWTDAEVPNRQRLTSFAAAYAGYSYVLLGEGFCTMAFSLVNQDRSIEFGGEISRDSVFRIAITRFTEAIAAGTASGTTDMIRMAQLGRARAKLNLGDWAGARTDAQQITSGYVRNATYSTTVGRRNNLVWNQSNPLNGRGMSVGEPYRTIGDTTSSTRDPRVPVVQSTIVSATGIQYWFQLKYPLQSSPIPIARFHEAQLIIAESHIRENNLALALPILNASRTRGNQGAFVGVTQADYLAELVNQRRRELFLESHHLGDIIRYSIDVQPPAGAVYHFGGSYGTQICFPLPQSERLNNPNVPDN